MADDPKRTFKTIRAQQRADIEGEREREAKRKLAMQRARRSAAQPPPDAAVAESPEAQWVRQNFEWNEYPSLWLPTVNGHEISSWSDYSGTTLDRANGKWLLENFAELFQEGYGGHGTVWVGMPEDKRLTLSPEDKERLEEVLNGLADYPVIDDDMLSTMEMEAKWEGWTEYGRDAVREGFVKKFSDNVNAQIAVVLQRNEFWDNMMREHSWDQYMDEEPGGSWAIHEESMVRDIGEDEIVNEDAVENWKRHWLLKNHGEEFERLLSANGMLADNGHTLWTLFKHGEQALGPESVWEVKDRFWADKDEADPDDYISLQQGVLEEMANLLSDQGQVDMAWKKQWANDPRQQRLPGFESQARELATALLDAEDPRAAFQSLPRFRFIINSFMGEMVYVETDEEEDWPLPIGTVIRDPDRMWRIVKGNQVTAQGWKWWEDVPHSVFSEQFPDKLSAAKRLWQLSRGHIVPVGEAEDPKSAFRKAHAHNPWGPKWEKQSDGGWTAQPLSNRIYRIKPGPHGYEFTEHWRGAMTGGWKLVTRLYFDTPEEVKAHFPVRLREAEDPKAAFKQFNRLPRKIEIWGKRWFSRTYGNTYFTAKIFVNDELVHTLPMEYGYGDQYMHRAYEWLEQNGIVPQRTRKDPPWRIRDEHGVDFSYHAEDVRRQRDLFT